MELGRCGPLYPCGLSSGGPRPGPATRRRCRVPPVASPVDTFRPTLFPRLMVVEIKAVHSSAYAPAVGDARGVRGSVAGWQGHS